MAVLRTLATEEHGKNKELGKKIMKKSLFVFLAAGLLLAGCHKDDDPNNNGGNGTKVQVKATLSQGAVTKVDVEPAEKGAEIFWTNGDKVGVFGNDINTGYYYAGALATTLEQRSKIALFEGSVIQNTVNEYYVCYPYNDVHQTNDGTAIPLDLTIQEGVANSFEYLSSYMHMVSREPSHLNNEKIAFSMEHLCVLLQFNLKLKDTQEGITLKSIEITGDNLENKKNLNVFDKKLSDAEGSKHKLTLSYPNGGTDIVSEKESIVAMTTFPVETGDVKVRVFVDDNGTDKYLDFDAVTVTFEAGKRYTKSLELDMSKAKDASIMKPEVIDYDAKTAQITTRAELAWVAAATNVGNAIYDDYNYNGFEGWALTQMNNINLEGDETKQWTPIGKYTSTSDNQPFKGSYDGNGHKIENLYINNTVAYQGLFGAVIGSSSNLSTIKGIILSGYVKGGSNVAGLSAYISYATISACVNRANVNGGGQVGGLIGTPAAFTCNLIACENYGTVTGSGNGAGGIAGTTANNFNAIACVNHGTVSGTGSSTSAGGITGSCSAATIVIASCINEGGISKTGGFIAYAGGVVGSMTMYNTTGTKELYFVNNADLFVTGRDSRNQGWNTKGPSLVSELNSDETIASLNAAIEEWNTNNPDYKSPSKFVSGGDDNTIPRLMPIE